MTDITPDPGFKIVSETTEEDENGMTITHIVQEPIDEPVQTKKKTKGKK